MKARYWILLSVLFLIIIVFIVMTLNCAGCGDSLPENKCEFVGGECFDNECPIEGLWTKTSEVCEEKKVCCKQLGASN